jgi:hypothetical protein
LFSGSASAKEKKKEANFKNTLFALKYFFSFREKWTRLCQWPSISFLLCHILSLVALTIQPNFMVLEASKVK